MALPYTLYRFETTHVTFYNADPRLPRRFRHVAALRSPSPDFRLLTG